MLQWCKVWWCDYVCIISNPDLIVEVAHPDIVAKYGKLFVTTADFMVSCRLLVVVT